MRLKLRKATGLNFYRGSFVAKPVRIRSHGAFNVVSQGFVVRRQVHFDVATWRPQNDDSYGRGALPLRLSLIRLQQV